MQKKIARRLFAVAAAMVAVGASATFVMTTSAVPPAPG